MNPFGYSEAVWTRFVSTPRAGVFAGGAVCARADSAASHAVLELQVRAVQGHIHEARFRALGCPTTIAVGAWIAETINDAPVAGLSAIDARRIRLALAIPDDRAHCALLGEDAVLQLRTQLR